MPLSVSSFAVPPVEMISMSVLFEFAGQLQHAAFVGDADQRAPDGSHGVRIGK